MSELLFVPSVIKTFTSYATKLTDENTRLRESKKAIYFNIEQGYFDKLVIVDGSNIDILSEEEIEEIESRGIQVEQMKFQQSVEDVQKFGKSYGEMLITNYMIKNSKLVNEFGSFVKISGRYNFDNASDVIPKIASLSTFFLNDHPFILRNHYPFTSTIMYKTSVEFFNEHLADCGSECSKDITGFLESIFFRRLHVLKRRSVSVPYPCFSGLSGVTAGPIIHQHLQKRRILSSLGFLGFTCDH